MKQAEITDQLNSDMYHIVILSIRQFYLIFSFSCHPLTPIAMLLNIEHATATINLKCISNIAFSRCSTSSECSKIRFETSQIFKTKKAIKFEQPKSRQNINPSDNPRDKNIMLFKEKTCFWHDKGSLKGLEQLKIDPRLLRKLFLIRNAKVTHSLEVVER